MSYDAWKTNAPDHAQPYGRDEDRPADRPLCRDCARQPSRHFVPTGSYCSDCYFARIQEGWQFDPRSRAELDASLKGDAA